MILDYSHPSPTKIVRRDMVESKVSDYVDRFKRVLCMI